MTRLRVGKGFRSGPGVGRDGGRACEQVCRAVPAGGPGRSAVTHTQRWVLEQLA